ncbi:hypothetical protein CB0101_12375 [Synechococcus sp. CB0101]|uniref:hypothetical protein n=1 Tax=Synechococcus sp. CB0101 TaxID=232348 RepID=UPI0010AB3EF4|nr:hypothetical protein [Synechococcus sp. CB0101]QCH15611.1 hypothetical protein CB0101_12375 [Synechococcus sp. CB0101]
MTDRDVISTGIIDPRSHSKEPGTKPIGALSDYTYSCIAINLITTPQTRGVEKALFSIKALFIGDISYSPRRATRTSDWMNPAIPGMNRAPLLFYPCHPFVGLTALMWLVM